MFLLMISPLYVHRLGGWNSINIQLEMKIVQSACCNTFLDDPPNGIPMKSKGFQNLLH